MYSATRKKKKSNYNNNLQTNKQKYFFKMELEGSTHDHTDLLCSTQVCFCSQLISKALLSHKIVFSCFITLNKKYISTVFIFFLSEFF